MTEPHFDAPLRAARRILAASADEHAAAKEIIANGMAPLVYDAISASDETWPASFVAAVRDEARRAAAHETLIEQELTIVCKALGDDALILKGSALAYTLYPRPELRPRGDTDLLIPAARLDFVRATLSALGYEAQTTSGDELGLFQQIFTKKTFALDVHWDVTNTPLIDELPFAELAARAIAIPALHGRGLAPVDALLHACVHRVAHHHDSERLIWLYDIHLLARAVDAGRFRALATARRVTTICARSLALAAEWFGESPLTIEPIADEPSALLLERDRKRGKQLAADLIALPGWRARGKRLWQLAFPPRAYVEETFGVRSAILLPAFYAYRAMRGITRLFRRDRG